MSSGALTAGRYGITAFRFELKITQFNSAHKSSAKHNATNERRLISPSLSIAR